MTDEQAVIGMPIRSGDCWQCPCCGAALKSHAPMSGLQCPKCGQAWSQMCVEQVTGDSQGESLEGRVSALERRMAGIAAAFDE